MRIGTLDITHDTYGQTIRNFIKRCPMGLAARFYVSIAEKTGTERRVRVLNVGYCASLSKVISLERNSDNVYAMI